MASPVGNLLANCRNVSKKQTALAHFAGAVSVSRIGAFLSPVPGLEYMHIAPGAALRLPPSRVLAAPSRLIGKRLAHRHLVVVEVAQRPDDGLRVVEMLARALATASRLIRFVPSANLIASRQAQFWPTPTPTLRSVLSGPFGFLLSFVSCCLLFLFFRINSYCALHRRYLIKYGFYRPVKARFRPFVSLFAVGAPLLLQPLRGSIKCRLRLCNTLVGGLLVCDNLFFFGGKSGLRIRKFFLQSRNLLAALRDICLFLWQLAMRPISVQIASPSGVGGVGDSQGRLV